MKKFYHIIFIFSVLCLFCAFTWPPENYEMPRTLLDASTVEDSFSGLPVSFGAIANIGLIILGIIISVSLIGTIFRRLFLGQVDKFNPPHPRSHRELNRATYSEVRERNLSGVFQRRLESQKERGGDRL